MIYPRWSNELGAEIANASNMSEEILPENLNLDKDSIPTRIMKVKAFLPAFERTVRTFMDKDTKAPRFKLLVSILGGNSRSGFHDAISKVTDVQSPKKLFILDSSYNPPTLAHAALPLAALKHHDALISSRLILLFSTSNADKGYKPATFQQRLAMMVLFALDLRDCMHKQFSGEQAKLASIPIDIALTSSAFYTDKSVAISESKLYQGSPTYVHLMGYDTLVRFLDPKYYTAKPPLSALSSYFAAGHEIQVLLRSNEIGKTEELGKQRAYVADLPKGPLLDFGFQAKWADQISIIESADVAGVSSTAVRDAIANSAWQPVSRMCMPGVAEWLMSCNPYADEAEKTTAS